MLGKIETRAPENVTVQIKSEAEVAETTRLYQNRETVNKTTQRFLLENMDVGEGSTKSALTSP